MTDWPPVHQQVVEKFAKGWAHLHPHAWDDMLHPDVELSQPLLTDATGRDRFGEEVRRLPAPAPDIRGEVLDWAGRDDLVFIDLRLTGTAGRAPISFRTFDKLRIAPDAVVIRREAAFDSAPIMRSVLTRPSPWWPWFRSGIGPFTARRAILPG